MRAGLGRRGAARRVRVGLQVVAALCGASCSPQAPRTSPAQTVTSAAVPTASGTPAVTPSATLAGCPATVLESSLRQVARLAGNPDDVTVAQDGSLWVSDTDANAVLHLSSTGAVLGRVTDHNAPEGTVILAGGRLAVADQRTNAIVVLTPGSGSPATTLASLPGTPGQLGVDGIGYDSAGERLLVPDSPTGELFSVAPGTGAMTVLSTGMGRIVDATIGPDGAIYAVAESAHGLQRVPASGGAAQTVGALTDLDDVVSLRGLLYVTDLGGAVWAVDPATGVDRRLVSGAGAPQGLAIASGRLVLVDETTGALMSMSPCD